MQNAMILGKNNFYSLDSHSTGLNNNVCIVGASGAGKTRSVVIPNLLQATGSYIVTDPKGNLYEQYGDYLKGKGYKVKKLDFTDPQNSVHYNFFNYIRTPMDIVKIAHMLAYENIPGKKVDPFWEQSAELLLTSMIAYLIEHEGVAFWTPFYLLKLIALAQSVGEDSSGNDTAFARIIKLHQKKYPESWAYKQFSLISSAPEKTWSCINITLSSKMRNFGVEEIMKLMSYDDIDIASIGREKTALFIVVSDTDRSLDNIVNLFFTQAMNELCRYADTECENSALPVPVRFIMDDFATNCKIDEFPRMIASIRSRNISTMIMIQAESQLEASYGEDGRTIVANCDTYMYLGGNDIQTAKAVSQRFDVPQKRVMELEVGKYILFRRGEKPVCGECIDLDFFLSIKGVTAGERKPQQKITGNWTDLKNRLSGAPAQNLPQRKTKREDESPSVVSSYRKMKLQEKMYEEGEEDFEEEHKENNDNPSDSSWLFA